MGMNYVKLKSFIATYKNIENLNKKLVRKQLPKPTPWDAQ